MTAAASAVALVCLCACTKVYTDPEDKTLGRKPSPELQEIIDHFPAGSIDTVAKADKVLEIAKVEKSNINARLYNRKLVCNKRFFVYACYEEAELQKKNDLFYLVSLEREAKRFKRHSAVMERDYARDEHYQKLEADLPVHEKKVVKYTDKIQKIQEKETRRQQAAQGIVADPSKRRTGTFMTPEDLELNVADFEAKMEEYSRRQEKVERAKAATQKKREAKAAKDAKAKSVAK